jgi:pyridine nucleotide-disulfide oxidoreductase family protein
VKDLLLVGAGHAHAVLLAELARQPLHGARLTLVAPHRLQLYSGMLPGVIAGHYRPEEARMDMARLAGRAFAEFIQGEVETLDPAARAVRLKGGRELRYGFASFNVGSRVDASLRGAAAHTVAVRPFENFMQRLAGTAAREVAVIGGGAAGAEVAMAIRHHGAGVTLYSDRMAFEPALGRRVAAALRRQGVDYRQGIAVDSIEPGPVVWTGASHQSFDLAVLATGAVAHAWPRQSGLATDARGFILVDAMLRSVSHPEVFAVGDCATVQGAPHPRSGVYSVRHGEALVANLRRLVAGEPVQPYRPQRDALVLISTGRRSAIASRGNWTAEGGWVWRWKDWLDRRWIRRVADAR